MRRPPGNWFPQRAAFKKSAAAASSSGGADSSRRAAEKLAAFISNAGGCIVQNDLSIFYARHPSLRKYIQGGLTHFCRKHDDLISFSAAKQNISLTVASALSFKPSFVVADVTARDVAKWLAAFVAKQGGRMSAANLTQFYHRHPSARKSMHGKVKDFCKAHPGLLRFEQDKGAGVICSAAKHRGKPAKQDAAASRAPRQAHGDAAAAAEAETNDEGVEPPDDFPVEPEGGAVAEDAQHEEGQWEEQTSPGAMKRPRSEGCDTHSRTPRTRRHVVLPDDPHGGDESGLPSEFLDALQPDAGTFGGTLGHVKASMQHCQAAFLALEGQLEAEAARAAECEARERRLEVQEHQCEAVREKLAAKEAQLEQAGVRVEDLEVKESLLNARQAYCERLSAQLAEKEAQLAEKEAGFAELERRLAEKEAHLDKRRGRHHAERAKLTAMKLDLEKVSAQVAEREAVVLAREQECDAREEQLRDREGREEQEEVGDAEPELPAGQEGGMFMEEQGEREEPEEREEQEEYVETGHGMSPAADLAVA